MKARVLYFALFAAFLMLIGGCSGSSDGGSGTVSMSVTDAKPVIQGNPTEVWITFTEVRAHKAGGDWFTLPMPQPSMKINLLEFQEGKKTDLVPPVRLPSGHYTQLRFEISDAYMVTDTGTYPLIVPSGVLRTDKNFDFNVPDDEEGDDAVDLTVDFDLSQSIVVTGNEQYKLKPVLHLMETKQAATIKVDIAAASFGTATQAVVTVFHDNAPVGLPLDDSKDEEYTKVTVTKASEDPTSFEIFWIVPNQNYIVQIDSNSDGTVDYQEAIPSSGVLPNGTFTLKGGAPI